MDQNDALSGQGGEHENLQGEPTSASNQSMEALLKNDAFSVELPQSGEIRQGTIASISPSQILVSIGAKSEGVISGRELEVIDAEEREALDVGQEIPVYVVSPEDANGNVVLSYKRAQEQISWTSVEGLLDEDEIVESEILGYNKGGLIVGVQGLRGFVPASQISAMRRSQAVGDTPEQRWAKMIGEEISVRIIEVDRSRRRLILSERAASSESRQSIKERVIEELEEGQVCTGRVTSLADFGAFVNINGADGLVHLSELSWDRIKHPSEILEVGQEVEVKVINIDHEKKRIGLSLRALSDDPWRSRVEKFSVGQLVEGVITRLTKFGAFARLEGDIEGLIHISEISENRIEHPKEELNEGEGVALRIIRIDPEQHRIGLSLRKVDSAAFADKDFKTLTQEFLEPGEDEDQAPFPEDVQPEEPPSETDVEAESVPEAGEVQEPPAEPDTIPEPEAEQELQDDGPEEPPSETDVKAESVSEVEEVQEPPAEPDTIPEPEAEQELQDDGPEEPPSETDVKAESVPEVEEVQEPPAEPEAEPPSTVEAETEEEQEPVAEQGVEAAEETPKTPPAEPEA
jgi:small subunit ribosomal protein S1